MSACAAGTWGGMGVSLGVHVCRAEHACHTSWSISLPAAPMHSPCALLHCKDNLPRTHTTHHQPTTRPPTTDPGPRTWMANANMRRAALPALARSSAPQAAAERAPTPNSTTRPSSNRVVSTSMPVWSDSSWRSSAASSGSTCTRMVCGAVEGGGVGAGGAREGEREEAGGRQERGEREGSCVCRLLRRLAAQQAAASPCWSSSRQALLQASRPQRSAAQHSGRSAHLGGGDEPSAHDLDLHRAQLGAHDAQVHALHAVPGGVAHNLAHPLHGHVLACARRGRREEHV